MNTPAWIGLGSNLGDREANLDEALDALAVAPGVAVVAVSSYHETRPVGGPPGQGSFLNAAARLETTLDPSRLLAALQGIEDRAGRVRTVRWGERTLDLDLLIFGSLVLDTPRLTLPHPRLAFRRFALAPLAELDPSLVEPITGRTIADLLGRLDRRPRLLALDGSTGQKAIVFRRLVEELPALGIGGDPSRDSVEGLNGMVEALRAGRWVAETLPYPWIVADDCSALDLLRGVTWDAGRDGPQADREALEPLLIVGLSGDREVPRSPGLLRIPVLRPASDTPEAIVDEVLATCRSIDGV